MYKYARPPHTHTHKVGSSYASLAFDGYELGAQLSLFTAETAVFTLVKWPNFIFLEPCSKSECTIGNGSGRNKTAVEKSKNTAKLANSSYLRIFEVLVYEFMGGVRAGSAMTPL